MSTPRTPDPGKLIMSVFTRDKRLFPEVFEKMEAIGGPLDLMSAWMDFDYTDYYHKEMGTPLFRRVMAFKPLMDQERLAQIKLATNEVEQQYLDQGNRLINIDPGYLLPSRFVLATGKDFSHRIYIGHKIYADLTLTYSKGRFNSLAWTYPDYAGKELQTFLTKVRNKYMLDLKAHKGREL